MYGDNILDRAFQEQAARMRQSLLSCRLALLCRDAYFYHGTSSGAAEAIFNEGLIPAGSRGSNEWAIEKQFPISVSDLDKARAAVSLTEDASMARACSLIAADATGGFGVILKIKIPAHAVSKLKAESEMECRFEGNIPPEWIVGWKRSDGELEYVGVSIPESFKRLIEIVQAQFKLNWSIHGATHWGRVYENGMKLAEMTSAKPEIVSLFAFLHDSRRVTDGLDQGHGPRGAEFAKRLRAEGVIVISDADFDLLTLACAKHSDGFTDADITVQVCWDADRLDLGRCGVRPDPRYLCTDAAKDEQMIEWAFRRSQQVCIFSPLAGTSTEKGLGHRRHYCGTGVRRDRRQKGDFPTVPQSLARVGRPAMVRAEPAGSAPEATAIWRRGPIHFTAEVQSMKGEQMQKDKLPESTQESMAQGYQPTASKAVALSTNPAGSNEPNFQSATAVRTPVNNDQHFEQISPAEFSKLTGGGK
jgi:uncharacterized protein